MVDDNVWATMAEIPLSIYFTNTEMIKDLFDIVIHFIRSAKIRFLNAFAYFSILKLA